MFNTNETGNLKPTEQRFVILLSLERGHALQQCLLTLFLLLMPMVHDA